MSGVRVAEADYDFETYVRIWNAITPDEPASFEQPRERRERDPRRLHLLAELDDGAGVPEGSFVALADDEIVGY